MEGERLEFGEERVNRSSTPPRSDRALTFKKELAMETMVRINYDRLLEQEHYRPNDLADLLEVDVNVIRQAVFLGELPALVLDHHVVDIRKQDVVHWLGDFE